MICVADNLQIINPVIENSVNQYDQEPIIELVKKCISAGAEAIDINPGPLSRDPEEKMRFLVETVQGVTDLPLLLDTTNPKALDAGLSAARNKTIINGFSLEGEKIEHILPLARKYRANIIGYLLYSNGHVPAREADSLQVALEICDAARRAGIEDAQLILDPIVAPVIWEDGMIHNRDILSVIRNLPDLCGFPVRTIAGISNLTACPGPQEQKLILEQSYLPMLADAGLTYVLMNVLRTDTVKTLRACDALLSSRIFAWEEF